MTFPKLQGEWLQAFDIWDLSGGQALVMIGCWQKRETIPQVFAPPWLCELLKPLFQNEAECEAIDMEMIFYSHTNETHFHKKGFALSLVLKVRIFGTRK